MVKNIDTGLQGKTEDELIFADQLRQMGFPMVSTAVIYYPGLSPGAKVVYTILCAHAFGSKNSSYPGVNRMAYMMGRSRASIIDYVKELKKESLISVIPGNRRAKKNNKYILKPIPPHIVEHFWEISGKER